MARHIIKRIPLLQGVSDESVNAQLEAFSLEHSATHVINVPMFMKTDTGDFVVMVAISNEEIAEGAKRAGEAQAMTQFAFNLVMKQLEGEGIKTATPGDIPGTTGSRFPDPSAR